MDSTVFKNKKKISTLIHLSTFLKYFFPFANFTTPILIWTFNKEKPFVDENGKQTINFQLSVLIYILLIGLFCIPFVLIFLVDFISLIQAIDYNAGDFSMNNIQNISGYILLFGLAILLLFGLFVFEIYTVINASIYASRGLLYKYPLCIPFIKINLLNQSENEHIS